MGDACGLDLRSMPKIELHAHLSGSIGRQCLHEIWQQKNSSKSDKNGQALQDPLIVMPENKYDYNLDNFFPLFSSYIYALCSDASSIIYSTNSVLQSFQDDGVVYLELRTTPRDISSAGITKEHYVQLVLSCISSFKSPTMITKLILSMDRRNSAQEVMDVVNLAIKYRSGGVVAVDLCGDPSKGDISIFREAFQTAKYQGLGITIHFAEAPQSSTDAELRTLLSYEPDRIGHVINVPEDIKKIIIARRIGLELCLSCNVHAKMISGTFADHHFGYYWRDRACPVILCTDDVGVFGSTLSHEYELIREHFHLSNVQLLDLARSGIECIFGGEDEKARLREVMWRSVS